MLTRAISVPLIGAVALLAVLAPTTRATAAEPRRAEAPAEPYRVPQANDYHANYHANYDANPGGNKTDRRDEERRDVRPVPARRDLGHTGGWPIGWPGRR